MKGSVMAGSKAIIPRDYADWLGSLKSRIPSARQRATLAVNQGLMRLYRQIGPEILERQSRQGWGARVIDRLAADLREAFPEMKGFSSSILKYMRFFAEKCPTGLIVQQPADRLPWFHIVTLPTRVSSESEREWYPAQVIQYGRSRPTLDVRIGNQLHLPQGGGRLLCRTKNRLVAEYALSGIATRIGVTEYQLVRALPEPLDTNLPSIDEIEAELGATEGETRRDSAGCCGSSRLRP